MKTKQVLSVVVLAIVMLGANALTLKKAVPQNKENVKIIAIFDGYDADDGYAFIITNEDEDEEIVYFSKITDAALKSVNLKSDDKIGKRFELTYEITEYEEEDENGYIEVYEEYTITNIIPMK